jgi:hypothetical protein
MSNSHTDDACGIDDMKPVAEPYPDHVLTPHMNIIGHEDQSSPDSCVKDANYNTHGS